MTDLVDLLCDLERLRDDMEVTNCEIDAATIDDAIHCINDLHKDAERYRWLRAQTWDVGTLAVVANPKTAVKLGHDCPILERLDAAIDAGIECAEHGHRFIPAGPKSPGLSICSRCGYNDRRKSA